ncbi:MAG: class I SAM-dependent methyltransferase [Thermodesulfobacteriota bacterium]
MGVEYSTVTELPGDRITHEQLARMFHRYRFAANFCEGKEVLEVACGAGQGLGYLARRATRVVGGDCTEKLMMSAREYYKDRVEIHPLDAHQLPFKDKSFDVLILYEALYYLAKPEIFFQEANRVLREGGVLLIATVNKDWPEFNPSPLSTYYFSPPELGHLLQSNGFEVEFYGAFSAVPKTVKEKIVATIRKCAIAFHLIPKTMKGKEFLKKIFYGKLLLLREEIEDGMCEYVPPVPIPSDIPNFEYKVIYAVARGT